MATILKNDNRSARKPCTGRRRDTFGKQRKKSFVTRKEAQAFMVDQERGKRYGRTSTLSPAKQRFTDVAEAHAKPTMPSTQHQITGAASCRRAAMIRSR
jgi:hypothetical protein